MKFRPCIDLHEGKVKQIVGETLSGDRRQVKENFVSVHDAAYYAEMFKRDGLAGGHVIMLGPGNADEAFNALRAYPGGLQVGGGVTAGNAAPFLEAGASHVIVTSYIFQDGRLNLTNLSRLTSETGKSRLVIDLSCKKRGDDWVVMTDRWSRYSDFIVNKTNMKELAGYCDEFLVHAVDVEGKQSGIQEELAANLANWSEIPVTYAGGVRSLEDLDRFRRITGGRIDITVGSALDIFGGSLSYRQAAAYGK